MFEPGKLYKNTNCPEIVFKVEDVEKRLAKSSIATAYRISGTWLNRHFGLIKIIEDTIFVEPDQIDKWEEFKQQEKHESIK